MKPAQPEHHSPRRYEVRHVTTYTYTEDVTASYGRACLRPRDTETQQVRANEIVVDPVPTTFTEHVDLFGNWSHYVEVHEDHRRLVVDKTSIVDVASPLPDIAGADRWTVADVSAPASERAGTAASRAAGGFSDSATELMRRTAYLLPSALVDLGPEVRAWARESLPPGAPLGTAIAGLVTRIHDEFPYRKGATTVRTTLPELLEIRAGVCQDFAHLAIGALRSVGVPARYVSGYLETSPPPGQPKLRGADATHAWLSAQLPDGTWLDLDPTNDCVADSRYIVTAWGRDYRDVAPLKGIIFTEGAASTLEVEVDVWRMAQDQIKESR